MFYPDLDNLLATSYLPLPPSMTGEVRDELARAAAETSGSRAAMPPSMGGSGQGEPPLREGFFKVKAE